MKTETRLAQVWRMRLEFQYTPEHTCSSRGQNSKTKHSFFGKYIFGRVLN